MYSQNPGVHSRPVPTVSPASPPDTPQNTGAMRIHITPLLSPNEGPGSQGTLTQRAVHQRELNRQSVHKGEIWSQEALPLKWEPHSQLTSLGVPRRRCSVVRRRERGRGGERRREIRREGKRGGGKREPRRRDGDADRGPGGGGDRFVYGQWGEGRGRREEPGEGRGFAALLPAWDSGGTFLQPWQSPRFPLSVSRDLYPLPSLQPWRIRVSRPISPAGRPGAAARDSGPLRDVGRKRQLLGVGPALPISRRSSPRFFFPWPVFVTVVEKAAARPWGLRQMVWGVRSPPRELFCLPRVP